MVWCCAALGPGHVLLYICCSTSFCVSVEAWVSSLSRVPCFCQGEGERPHEILDLACGLPVVPKEEKNNGADWSNILALATGKVKLKDAPGLILAFQASENEGVEEPV